MVKPNFNEGYMTAVFCNVQFLTILFLTKRCSAKNCFLRNRTQFLTIYYQAKNTSPVVFTVSAAV